MPKHEPVGEFRKTFVRVEPADCIRAGGALDMTSSAGEVCTLHKVIEAYTEEHKYLEGKFVEIGKSRFRKMSKGPNAKGEFTLFAWVGDIQAEAIAEEGEELIVVTKDLIAQEIKKATESWSGSSKIDGEIKNALID